MIKEGYESYKMTDMYKKPAKYKFIRDFVIAMAYIEAEEKVMNELDLKSLLLFTRLYTRVIRKMRDEKIDMTIENIEREMTEIFDNEREKYSLHVKTKNLRIQDSDRGVIEE